MGTVVLKNRPLACFSYSLNSVETEAGEPSPCFIAVLLGVWGRRI